METCSAIVSYSTLVDLFDLMLNVIPEEHKGCLHANLTQQSTYICRTKRNRDDKNL